MPSLIKSCKELFGTDNLYDVMKVRKSASAQEVRKAYHKASLLCHPDRVESDRKEDATKRFQTLGKVYSILSDKEKRNIYDETGDIDEENDISEERDWYNYWRLLFAKLSFKDIENYKQKYQGSEEEVKDLKAAYLESEGDMSRIIDSVLCASVEDEERFKTILTKLIKNKELPNLKKFSKETKTKKAVRRKRAEEEAVEAEAAAKELGLGDSSLEALIKKRQKSRESLADNFFSQLEAKYSEPKPKMGKKNKQRNRKCKITNH